jgi:glycosidase
VDFLIHFNEPPYQHLLNPWVDRHTEAAPFFAQDGCGDILGFLDGYLKSFRVTRQLGYIALPTGNHDFSRLRFHGREENDLKVIFTMLFSMPGVPFLYYGDEIGMRYFPDWPKKEGAMWRGGCRTPMQWNSTAGAGFSTASEEEFYLPLDPDPQRPNVETQEKDEDSLLNFVRRLTTLRHDNKALGNFGGFEPLYAEKSRFPFVYRRTGAERDFIVAINPTNSRQTCIVPALINAKPVIKIGDINVEGSKLLMPPVSSAIFEIPPE